MSVSKVKWALVVTMLTGCGGATVNDLGDGGTSGDGGTGDGGRGGGIDAGVFVCPPSAPTNGAACEFSCPKTGAPCVPFQCEYGTSPILQCNELFTCDGTWSADARGNDPQFCSPTPSGCPATRATVPVGAPCSPSTLECSFPEGRCACTVSSAGPVRVDAGAEWICDTPQGDCPRPRPHVGSACAGFGRICDYGACSLPGGSAVECSEGRWQEHQVPCPD
ncbi:MAG: hypothetical protein ABIP89_22295 [Polyangiaceae bacterium]